MKYKFLITAVTALAFTACSEGKKTPDGYAMDNPPPSAYSPSDYETFDEDEYEVTSADEVDTAEEVIVDEVVGEAEDEVDGKDNNAETDEIDEKKDDISFYNN